MNIDDLKHFVLGRLESLEFCTQQITNTSNLETKDKYIRLLEKQLPQFIKEIREGLKKNE